MNQMKTHALLGQIIGRVTKLDRESKAVKYTDTDEIWTVLRAIKRDALQALKALRSHK